MKKIKTTCSNQYLGQPVFHNGGIINLLVDFNKGEIQIIRYEHENKSLFTEAVLPLSVIKDCYNLRLNGKPLIVRDFHSGAILERFSGTIKEMPNGQKWLFV